MYPASLSNFGRPQAIYGIFVLSHFFCLLMHGVRQVRFLNCRRRSSANRISLHRDGQKDGPEVAWNCPCRQMQTGRRITQPRARLFDHPCTAKNEKCEGRFGKQNRKRSGPGGLWNIRKRKSRNLAPLFYSMTVSSDFITSSSPSFFWENFLDGRLLWGTGEREKWKSSQHELNFHELSVSECEGQQTKSPCTILLAVDVDVYYTTTGYCAKISSGNITTKVEVERSDSRVYSPLSFCRRGQCHFRAARSGPRSISTNDTGSPGRKYI